MADDDTIDNTTNDDDFQANDSDDANPLYQMKQDQKLPQDNNTPFSPPSGIQDRIDDTHQQTDVNIDEHEHYDAGIEEAADIDLPGEAADEDDNLPVS